MASLLRKEFRSNGRASVKFQLAAMQSEIKAPTRSLSVKFIECNLNLLLLQIILFWLSRVSSYHEGFGKISPLKEKHFGRHLACKELSQEWKQRETFDAEMSVINFGKRSSHRPTNTRSFGAHQTAV